MKHTRKSAEYSFKLSREQWKYLVEEHIRNLNPELPLGEMSSVYVIDYIGGGESMSITFTEIDDEG